MNEFLVGGGGNGILSFGQKDKLSNKLASTKLKGPIRKEKYPNNE